jgi:hypothetical protein
MKRSVLALSMSAMLIAVAAPPVGASHSWGTYHWARTANPFTLKLGDNVTSQWDAYLAEASTDWSKSSVLDTTIVAGGVTNVKKCPITAGRIEVCNSTYGNNGWLGIAGISLSGGHITGAYVKLNDSYFNSASYNKPEWRRLVMCQEIGHGFGLDHTDENFNNANHGTCMDYTNVPLGPPSNERPNAHDYDQLASIYAHLDSTTTTGADAPGGPGNGRQSRSRVENVDANGNGSVTFITWVE